MSVRRRGFALVASCLLTACTTALDLGDGAYPDALVAGPRASCIVAYDGGAQCIGAGGDGQFGVDPASLHTACGDDRCDAEPTRLPVGRVRSLAIGDRFLCVVSAGEVRCAGSDALGTLGRGTRDLDAHTTFLPVDLGAPALEVVAGRAHACARLEGGTVSCWGFAGDGALGRDPATTLDCGPLGARDAGRLERTDGEPARCAPSPLEVPGLDDAVALRAGPFGTCVRRAGGAFVCFGRNVDGSLGVGPTAGTVVSTPTPLAREAQDVALGRAHGVLLDARGLVYTFGRGGRGQLGLGTGTPSSCGGTGCAPTPTRVADLAEVTAVAAGDDHSCALRRDGTVACMGADDVGQLGDSMAPADDCAGVPCATRPHDAAQATPVRSLHAAGSHTLWVDDGARTHAFGGNAFRECGHTDGAPVTFPSMLYWHAF